MDSRWLRVAEREVPGRPGWPEVRAIFEFLIAVNWAAIVFIVFSAAFVIYLSGLEKKSDTFRLEQAFSDADGRAYSPSLLYIACFPLGWLMIFYFLVAKEYTQASAVFAAMFAGSPAAVSRMSRSSYLSEVMSPEPERTLLSA